MTNRVVLAVGPGCALVLGAFAFLAILAGAFMVIPAVVEVLLICAGLYLAAWLAVQVAVLVPRRIYRYIEPLGPNGDLTGALAVLCWYAGAYIVAYNVASWLP